MEATGNMVAGDSFRNGRDAPVKVYLEPSAEELWLQPGEVLLMVKKCDGEATFEIEYRSDGDVVVWIPRGQSADCYIDGRLIETICSQFVW